MYIFLAHGTARLPHHDGSPWPACEFTRQLQVPICTPTLSLDRRKRPPLFSHRVAPVGSIVLRTRTCQLASSPRLGRLEWTRVCSACFTSLDVSHPLLASSVPSQLRPPTEQDLYHILVIATHHLFLRSSMPHLYNLACVRGLNRCTVAALAS